MGAIGAVVLSTLFSVWLALSPAVSASATPVTPGLVYDAEGPAITAVSIAPEAIDVTGGKRTVKIDVSVHDAGSGVDMVTARLAISAGGANYLFEETAFRARSGDDHRGIYRVKIMIPRNSWRGGYRLTTVIATDQAGNPTRLDEPDLAARGFGGAIRVANTNPDYDETPPDILAVSTSPASIDVTDEPRTVALDVGCTDGGSGVARLFARFEIEAGGQIYTQQGSGTSVVSGDRNDGVLRVLVTFPANSWRGVYRLAELVATDGVGNERRLDGPTLAETGMAVSVEVANSDPDYDPTGPIFESLSAAPLEIDVTNERQAVVFDATVSDAGSGVEAVYLAVAIEVDGATHRWDAWAGRSEPGGVYRLEITFPRNSWRGTYRVVTLLARDHFGNVTRIEGDDLAEAGFAIMIAVSNTNPEAPPNSESPEADAGVRAPRRQFPELASPRAVAWLMPSPLARVLATEAARSA